MTEGSQPLCAVPLGWKGWLYQQHCSRDTVAVALLCSACIAMHPAVLSTRPGQGQGILCGVGTADFYVRDMPAIPKTFHPSWPSGVNLQVLESGVQAPQAVLGHRDGWVP